MHALESVSMSNSFYSLNAGRTTVPNWWIAPIFPRGRQNFVTELQILASCICPIKPKIRMCHLKYIYCVDTIDVFCFSCGNSWDLLKLARVLPKRKEMALYYLAKYRRMGAMGRAVEDFMRGQEVSQRACHKRVIAREKSVNHLWRKPISSWNNSWSLSDDINYINFILFYWFLSKKIIIRLKK